MFKQGVMFILECDLLTLVLTSPAGDGVALAGAAAHQLEVLLGDLEVFPGAVLLAHCSVHHPLEYVLLGHSRLQVLQITC